MSFVDGRVLMGLKLQNEILQSRHQASVFELLHQEAVEVTAPGDGVVGLAGFGGSRSASGATGHGLDLIGTGLGPNLPEIQSCFATQIQGHGTWERIPGPHFYAQLLAIEGGVFQQVGLNWPKLTLIYRIVNEGRS